MPSWEFVKIRLYWAFTSLIFFALPLLIIIHGFGTRWEAGVRLDMQQKFLHMKEILVTLRGKEDPTEYLPLLIRGTLDQLLKHPDPLKLLKGRLRALKRRLPGVFRFTVVDGRGRLVPALTDGSPDPGMVSQFYQALSKVAYRTGDHDHDRVKRAWPMCKAFVGEYADVEQFDKQNNDLEVVNLGNTDHWFTYQTEERYGLFVHISQPEGWEDLALRDLTHRFNRGSRQRRGGLETVFLNLQAGQGRPHDLGALGKYRTTSNPELVWDKRLFSFMEIRANSYLWASLPFDQLEILNRWQIGLAGLGLVLFTILALISYGVVIGRREMRFSIRQRLLLLFFFAAGLPVTVLILTGFDYLEEKVQARTRGTYEEMEKIIRSLDTNFVFLRGRIQTSLKEAAGQVDFDRPETIDHFHRRLDALMDQFKVVDFSVYDRSGRMVWRTKNEYDDEMKKPGSLGKLLKNLLATLNKEPPQEGIDPVSLMMESLGGFGNPVHAMTRNINKMFRFAMAGGKKSWYYFGAIFDKKGVARQMVRTSWKKADLEQVYCRTFLPPMERIYPDTRFFYFNLERDFFFPSRSEVLFAIPWFYQLLKLTKAAVSLNLRVGRERCFVTGMPLKECEDGYLVAIRPEKTIQAEISAMRRNLWLFTVGIILISLFLGHQLAQRFLEPISRLFTGVTALQARQFDFRIPAMEPDEFGLLGETFNQVMGGMQDLDVGRIVQESLFPKEPLQVGNFRIFGSSVSAGELGGDYFDFQLLPDGKALVVIGDVSGHGLPAALVMAMARAMMERECLIDSRPEVILQSLHRIILKTMKRKRMMTCFVGVLDPVTSTLHFANAGHSFPFYFRPGEPPKQIEGGGTPLGAMKNLKLTCMDLTMAPGDKLFFYTDGLVEAKVDGQQLGYQRMGEEVGRVLTDDPREACERVIAWHRGLTGTGPQEDDITMVLITCPA